MYLCHFFTSVYSTEHLFASGSRVPLFVDINTLFQKGDSILILILYFNERSRMAQGETPLLLVVIGPHNIRRQHFLMLWWVLLCDCCSYSCPLLKTCECGRAINAHIIIAAYYNDHCPLFRVCSFVELSSAFIITAPEGAAVVYTNTSIIFFQSYITRAWVCTQLYIFSLRTSLRRSRYRFLFFQWIAPKGPTLAFPYNNILSRRNIDGFRLYVCS
jgi:hypothetical protein